MVAITSGLGLGVYTSVSPSQNNGSSTIGRNSEGFSVNAATGNLILQNQDERLSALGLDLGLVRTYNSLGLMNDDNGDNWRLGVHRRVSALTGTINTAGSTVTKTFGDGADVLYTYSATLAKYVSTDGDGAHDTLSWNATTQQWTFTDGSSRVIETYNASGQLINSKDTDGNTVTYTYTGTLLTSITDASGQTTAFTYSGNNLKKISVTSNGVSQSLIYYAYDSSNRLRQVAVDLTPGSASDTAIADANSDGLFDNLGSGVNNQVYLTTYTYDGTSKRVASIAQSDGSSISFTYQQLDGQYRVASYTVANSGGNRTTNFAYSSYNATGKVYQQTVVTDPLGLGTTYKQDANGRLVSVVSPAINGASLQTDYGYDNDGNLTSITEDPAGLKRTTTFEYDASGNLKTTRDALGNTITYTYSATNQLLTETRYLVPDPDGAGTGQPGTPLTTRYVYDSEEHLRFVISADGRVTEHRYDAPGNRVMTLSYRVASYTAASFTLTDLQTWATTQKNSAGFLANIERLDYAYDFRGQLTTLTHWATLTAWTAIDGSASGTTGNLAYTRFIYDQRGQLLQTIEPRGDGNLPDAANPNLPFATTYTYDGLGRQLTASKWVQTTGSGATTTQVVQVTTFQYDDLGNRTSIIDGMANPLLTSDDPVYQQRRYDLGFVSTTTSAGYTVAQLSPTNKDTLKALYTTTYQYNGAGELTGVTGAQGRSLVAAELTAPGSIPTATTSYKYDADGRLRLVIDRTGVRQFYFYDEAGRKIAEVDGDGTLTEYVYNKADDVVKTVRYADLLPAATLASLVDASINPTNVSLVTLQTAITRQSGATLPASAAKDQITRAVYNGAGQLVFTVDAAGAVTQYVYDGAGRVTDTIQYATTVTINRTLDEVLLDPPGTPAQAGHIVVTADNANDRRIRTFYDNDGNVTGVLDAAGYLTETIYDQAGHVSQIVAYANKSANLTGTTLALVRPSTDTVTTDDPELDARTYFYYDAQGREIGRLDAEGYLTETNYNASGVVETVTRYDFVQTYSATATVADYRTAAASAVRHKISYVYDGAGRLIQETAVSGTTASNDTIITSYSYDIGGNLIGVAHAGATTEARWTQTRYDALGRVVRELSGEGSAQITSSSTGAQIESIWVKYGTSYTYDTAGRKTSSTVTAYDSAAGTTQTYTTYLYYDNDSRLRFEVDNARDVIEHHYDALGQLDYSINYSNPLSALPTQLGGLLTTSLETVLRPGTSTSDGRTNYSYALNGQVSSVSQDGVVDGNTSFVYNAFGEEATRIESIDTSRARLTVFTYDTRGLLKSTLQDAFGLNVGEARDYDAFGRLIKVTDPRGAITKYEYDRLNRQTATIDAYNARQSTSYDAFGRVVTSVDAIGNGLAELNTEPFLTMRKQLGYTKADGTAKQVTDLTQTDKDNLRKLYSTSYTYDDATRSTTVKTPEGIEVKTVFNRHGQTQTVTVLAVGNTTTYNYNSDGELKDVKDTLGGATALEAHVYDSAGREVSTTDARGTVTKFIYDSANRLFTRTVDSGGLALQTKYEYDGQGRIVKLTEPNGRVTTTTYNPDGSVKETAIDPSGLNLRTSYSYDRTGDVLTVVERGGTFSGTKQTQYVYDNLGRKTEEIVDPTSLGGTLNLRTQYKYDANGNLTRVIDPRGMSTWYVYDNDNRLIYTINALGEVTQTTYDLKGRVSATREYANRLAAASVATFGDVVSASSVTIATDANNDQVAQFFYDKDDRARYTLDAMGNVTEQTFDANGQVIKSVSYTTRLASGAYTTLKQVQTAVATNAVDLTSQNVYDLRGRLAFSINGVGDVTQYQYDAANNVIQTTRYATRYDLTQAVNLSALNTWASGTTVANNSQNSTTKFAYDRAGRLRITTDGAGVRQFAFYDEVGNRTADIDGDGTLTEYVYNKANQVVKTIRYADRVSTATLNSLVDANGSPTAVTLATVRGAIPTTVGRAKDQITRAVYNSAGELIYTIDAAGDVSRNYYDTAGRLVSVFQYATPVSIPASANELTLINADGTPLADGTIRDPATSTTYTLSLSAANVDRDGNGVTDDTEKESADRRVRFIYDENGNRRGVLDPAGYLTEYVYDKAGRLAQAVVYANQVPTTSATNTTLRLTGTLDELKTAAGTDNETALDTERDANTYFYYNAQGQEEGVLDAEGYLTETQYNVAGQVAKRIRYDRVFTYSATATVASMRNAVAGTATRHIETYTYDGAGRLTETRTGEGTGTTVAESATQYGYNAAGETLSTLTAAGSSDARMTQQRYDALGRVKQELSGEGSKVYFTYLFSNPTGTPAEIAAQIEQIWADYGTSYEYDSAGRRTSATTVAFDKATNTRQTSTTRYYYDNDNRLCFEVNGAGEVIEYRYNAFGQRDLTIAYTNRLASLPTQVGGLLTSSLITALRPVANSTSDARTAYTYTLAGQVASITTAATGDTDGASVTYSYTAFGEEQSHTETLDAIRTRRTESRYDTRGLLKVSYSDAANLNTTEKRDYDAFGRLRKITDPRGNSQTFDYDRLGRTITSTDALTAKRVTTYDAFDRVLTITDALNNKTTYAYKDEERKMTVTTQEGVAIETVRNAQGETLTIKAAGDTTTHQYNANGQLTSVSDDLGTLESRAYDSAGRQVTDADARGTVTRFSYDAANRVLTRTVDTKVILADNDNPNGLALQTKYEYDGQGRLVKETAPSGSVTETMYYRDGRVKQVTVDSADLKLFTAYTYDRAGNVATVAEGAGTTTTRRTQYLYDTLGRRIEEILDPTSLGGTLNLRTQYKYDANGNVTRRIDANGNPTWYVYDKDNRLTHTIDALGNVTETVYDLEDRVIAVRAYATAVSTTNFGDVVTATRPSGSTVSWNFQSGTAAAVTVANATLDRLEQTVYDKDGRARYSINAVGTVIERTFDDNGNVTRSRSYSTPIAVANYTTIAQVQTAITNALTAAGKSTTAIDSADHMNWNLYDLRGRAIYTVDGTGAVVGYEYDGAGNITKKTAFSMLMAQSDPVVFSTVLGYLDLIDTTDVKPDGKPTNVKVKDSSKNQVTSYWYDGANRLRFTLDAEGYLSELRYNDAKQSVNDDPDLRVGATYFATESRAIRYAGGPFSFDRASTFAQVKTFVDGLSAGSADQTTVTLTDMAGRVTKVTDAEGNATYFAYDALGNRTASVQSFSNPEVAPHWAVDRTYYDALGREIFSLSAMLILTEYRYDAAGNRTQVIRYQQPLATAPAAGTLPTPITGDSGYSTAYTYDAANRLDTETNPLGVVTKREYDAHGNVKTLYEAYQTAEQRTTTYKYNATDRVTDSTRASGTLVAVTTHVDYDAFGNIYKRHEAYGTPDVRITTYLYDRNNRLTIETNALNISEVTSYDAFGNIKQRVAAFFTADQRIESFTYDRRNLMLSHTNAAGEREQYRYDALGNQVYVINANYDPLINSDIDYYKDLRKRIGLIDSATGQGMSAAQVAAGGVFVNLVIFAACATAYAYDRDNRLSTVTDANGVTTRYKYDGNGNKIEMVQAEARVGEERHTYYRYDEDNNLRKVIDPMGGVTAYVYNALRQVIGVTDANGGVEVNAYDASGRLTDTTSAGGVKTHNDYDRRGNVVRSVRSFANGTDERITTYAYDVLDRQTVMTDGAGFSTTITYDRFGNMASVTTGQYLLSPADPAYDPALKQRALNPINTTYTYDAIGRIKTTTDGENNVTRYEYDNVSNRKSVTVADNGLNNTASRTTLYEYDAANRLKKVTTPMGGTTSYEYDATGRKTSTSVLLDYITIPASGGIPAFTVPVISTTKFEYDKVGNLTAEVDALGVRTEHTYDAVGNMTSHRYAAGVLFEERTVRMEYDLNNRKIADIDALNNRTSYVHDKVGNRIKVIDALNHVARYYYNKGNQLVAVLDPEGFVNTFQYDSSGNRIEERVYFTRYTGAISDLAAPSPTANSALDRVTTRRYDGVNRAISVENAATRTDYVYDGTGNVLKETVTPIGTIGIVNSNGLTFVSAGATRVKQYTYDKDGRAKTLIDVDGTLTLYGYDGADNLTSEAMVNYNDANILRQTTYEYDLDDRRVKTTVSPGGLSIVMQTAYDKAGNVKWTIDGNNHKTTYGYDLNSRLVQVNSPIPGSQPVKYTYDSVGNKKTVTDARGNTTTYYYDLNNRLQQVFDAPVEVYYLGASTFNVSPSTTTYYDAVGNAVQTLDRNGNVTTRHYDGNGHVVAEIKGDNALCEYTYNAAGEVLTKTEYMTRLDPSAQDPAKRPTPPSASGADAPRVTSYEYDRMGRLTRTVYPSIDVTTVDVVSNTNTPSQSFASNSAVSESHLYDAYGNEIATWNREGKVSYSFYDVKGRKIAAVDALGYLVEWDYDAADNQIAQRLYETPFASADAAFAAVTSTPQLASVAVAQPTTTNLTVTVSFTDLISATTPPKLLYGAPGVLGSTPVTFAKQANGTYVATINGVTSAQAQTFAYKVQWTDVRGVTYSGNEMRFENVADQAGVKSTRSVSNGIPVVDTDIPISLVTGANPITQVAVQYRVLNSGTAYTMGALGTLTSTSATAYRYHMVLDGPGYQSPTGFEAILYGIRADGSKVALGHFYPSIADTTKTEENVSWKAPNVGEDGAVVVLGGLRIVAQPVVLADGRVLVPNFGNYVSGSTADLNVYYTKAYTQTHSVTMSSTPVTGSATNYNVKAEIGLTATEAANINTNAAIGSTGLHIAWRNATTGVQFANDVVMTNVGNNVFQANLSNLAGNYDVKIYYIDKAGREVIVEWDGWQGAYARTANGVFWQMASDTSQIVLARELGGVITRNAQGFLVTDPGLYTGPVSLPPTIGSSGGTGRPVPPTGKVRVVTRKYDAASRLLEEQAPAIDVFDPNTQTTSTQRPVTRYTYDAAGNLRSRTIGIGLKSDGTYVGLRADGTPDPALTQTEYSLYDEANRRVYLINAGGVIHTFKYDGNGNITERRRLYGTLPGDASTVTTDVLTALLANTGTSPGADEVTTYDYDEMNRLVREADLMKTDDASDDLVKTYRYDKNGNRTAMIDEDGNGLASSDSPFYVQMRLELGYWKLDTQGNIVGKRVADLTDAQKDTLRYAHATQLAYDGMNRVIRTRLADGQETLAEYDATGNQTALYTGLVRDAMTPASNVGAAVTGTNTVTINWKTTSSVSSFVFYDTVSRSSVSQYGFSIAAASGATQLALTSLAPGSTIYFRVVTKDSSGNMAWTAEKSFTVPPRMQSFNIAQTATNTLTLTATFDMVVAGVKLLYGAPGALTSSLDFIRQTDGTYKATFVNANPEALAYKIQWQDGSNKIYTGAEARFEASGADYVATVSNTTFGTSGSQLQINVDAAIDQNEGFDVINVLYGQVITAPNQAVITTTVVAAGVPGGDGTSRYHAALNISTAGNYDIAIVGKRRDGSLVTLDAYRYSAQTGATPLVRQAISAAAPPAGNDGVVIIDGVRANATRRDGRLIAENKLVTKPNASVSAGYQSFGTVQGTIGHMLSVTPTLSGTTYNIAVQLSLDPTLEVPNIGTGGVHLAWRPAGTGATFPNDVVLGGSGGAYSTTLASRPAGSYDLKLYYIDKQGREVIVDWTRVSTAAALNIGGTSQTIVTRETTGVLSHQSASDPLRGLWQIDPGLYIGAVDAAKLASSTILDLATSDLNLSGAQRANGNAAGQFVENRYNALGYLIGTNHDDDARLDGAWHDFGVNINGQATVTTIWTDPTDGTVGDGGGGLQTYIERYAKYDSRGRKVAEWGESILDPTTNTMLHPVQKYSYDVADNLTSYTNQNGKTWSYEYNALNVRVKETDALQGVKQTRIDIYGNVTANVSEKNFTALKFYDNLGRLVKERNAEGDETGYGYDYFDRLTSKTDGRGMATALDGDYTETYQYDQRDRLILVKQAQGWHLANDNGSTYGDERARLGYASDISATPLTSAQKAQLIDLYSIRYGYNGRNDRTDTVNHLVQRVHQMYDAFGRAINTRTYGRLNADLAPTGGSALNIWGDLTNSYQSGMSSAWSTGLNDTSLSQVVLTGATTDLVALEVRTYDTYGNLIREDDGENRTKTWQYAPYGRLLREVDEDGNEILYSYDVGVAYGFNNPTRAYNNATNRKNILKTYDQAGRLTSISDSSTHVSTTYTYDLTGNRLTEVVSNPDVVDSGVAPLGRNVTNYYDALGRLTYWKDSVTGMNIAYEYDAEGNRVHAFTDFGWDPTSQNTTGSSTYRYVDHVYVFDKARRVTDELDRKTDPGYTLDPVTGLFYHPVTDTPHYHFVYDRAGNRATLVNALQPAEVRTLDYTYDAVNRVVSADFRSTSSFMPPAWYRKWAYDPRGNITEYVEYDPATNRSTTATFSRYNDLNLPVAVKTLKAGNPDQLTIERYDRSLRKINTRVLDSAHFQGQALVYTYSYYGDGRDKNIVASGIANGNTSWTYNTNKEIIGTNIGKGDAQVRDGVKKFSLDNEGHILFQWYDTGTDWPGTTFPNGVTNPGLPKIYFNDYLYVNGEPVGEIQHTAYKPAETQYLLDTGNYGSLKFANDKYPGMVSTFIARLGDTLMSVAAAVYGNPSLWFVLADANGLDPTAPLSSGQQLNVPNTVQGGLLNADTHNVYDQSRIVGNVLPNLKAPPPKKKSFWDTFTKILIIVVIGAIVTAVTAGVGGIIVGAAVTATAATTAGGVAATVGIYAAVGAVAATVGSVMQQEAFIAAGFQKKFSWGQLEGDAVAGGLSGAAIGVGKAAHGLALAGKISGTGSAAAAAASGLFGASSNLVTQKTRDNNGDGKFDSQGGLFENISWTNVAAAGLQSALSTGIEIAEGQGGYTTAAAAKLSKGSYMTSTARALSNASIFTQFVTPWVRLGEKKGPLGTADAIGAVGDDLIEATTLGEKGTASVGEKFLRYGLAADSILMTSSVMSAYDPNAADQYAANALGAATGRFYGGLVVTSLQGLWAPKKQSAPKTFSSAADFGGFVDANGNPSVFQVPGMGIYRRPEEASLYRDVPMSAPPGFWDTQFAADNVLANDELMTPSQYQSIEDPTTYANSSFYSSDGLDYSRAVSDIPPQGPIASRAIKKDGYTVDQDGNLISIDTGILTTAADAQGEAIFNAMIDPSTALEGFEAGYLRNNMAYEESTQPAYNPNAVTPYSLIGHGLIGAAKGIYNFWLQPLLETYDISQIAGYMTIEAGLNLREAIRTGDWEWKYNLDPSNQPPTLLSDFADMSTKSIFGNGEASIYEQVWRAVPVLNLPFATEQLGEAVGREDWNTVVETTASVGIAYTKLGVAVNNHLESLALGRSYQPKAPVPLNYVYGLAEGSNRDFSYQGPRTTELELPPVTFERQPSWMSATPEELGHQWLTEADVRPAEATSTNMSNVSSMARGYFLGQREIENLTGAASLDLAGVTEDVLEGMPTPLNTASRRGEQMSGWLANTVDTHLHPGTARDLAGFQGYNRLDTGGYSLGQFLGTSTSNNFFFLGQIREGFEHCCPNAPYYLGTFLRDDGSRSLRPESFRVWSDSTLEIPKRWVYEGYEGRPVAIEAGRYQLDYFGLDPRKITVPKTGYTEMGANVIPAGRLAFNDQARTMDLMNNLMEIPEQLRSRVALGLTNFNPTRFGSREDVLDALAHAERIDPKRTLNIFGFGEWNIEKEAIMRLLPEDNRFNWRHSEALHETLGWINENLPGFAMTVHMDAGRPLEIGMVGRADKLLVHAPVEYSNVAPLVDIANRYPNINFIWAHGGGLSRSGYPQIGHTAVLRTAFENVRNDNLYVDMSWDVVAEKIIQQNNTDYLHSWAGPGGKGIMNQYADRFLFGSDAVAPRSVEGYRATLDVYEKGGLLQNLQNPDLFLRQNALNVAMPAIESIRNYRIQNSQQLLNRALPYPWAYGIPAAVAAPWQR